MVFRLGQLPLHGDHASWGQSLAWIFNITPPWITWQPWFISGLSGCAWPKSCWAFGLMPGPLSPASAGRDLVQLVFPVPFYSGSGTGGSLQHSAISCFYPGAQDHSIGARSRLGKGLFPPQAVRGNCPVLQHWLWHSNCWMLYCIHCWLSNCFLSSLFAPPLHLVTNQTPHSLVPLFHPLYSSAAFQHLKKTHLKL